MRSEKRTAQDHARRGEVDDQPVTSTSVAHGAEALAGSTHRAAGRAGASRPGCRTSPRDGRGRHSAPTSRWCSRRCAGTSARSRSARSRCPQMEPGEPAAQLPPDHPEPVAAAAPRQRHGADDQRGRLRARVAAAGDDQRDEQASTTALSISCSSPVSEEATRTSRSWAARALGEPYLSIPLPDAEEARRWLSALSWQMLTPRAMGFSSTRSTKAVVLALFVPADQSPAAATRARRRPRWSSAPWRWASAAARLFRVIGGSWAAGSPWAPSWGDRLRADRDLAEVPAHLREHHLLVASTVAAALIGVVTFAPWPARSCPSCCAGWGSTPPAPRPRSSPRWST